MALFKKKQQEFTSEELEMIEKKREEDRLKREAEELEAMKAQEEDSDDVVMGVDGGDFYNDIVGLIDKYASVISTQDIVSIFKSIEIELIKNEIINTINDKADAQNDKK